MDGEKAMMRAIIGLCSMCRGDKGLLMDYKLPDPDDSRRSWENIWLGCVDAKFYSKPATHNTLKTGMTDNQKALPVHRQHPKSIHQISCGEGFDHRERAAIKLNSAIVQLTNQHRGYTATPLGSNPREFRDWIIKKRLSF